MTDGAPEEDRTHPSDDRRPPSSRVSEAWAVLRGLQAAFVMLTRVPAGGFPYTRSEWRWGLAWAPAIGSFVGWALACVWSVSLSAGPWVASVVCVACGLVLTGALHEDGLADTADALGGGRDAAHVLQILKDPRMGVYGTVALVVSFLVRVASLATLVPYSGAALVLAHTLARTPPIWLAAALPYISANPRAGSVVSGRPLQVMWATAWSTAVLGAAVGLQTLNLADALLVAAAVGLATWTCLQRFRARVGGVNGDLLGAAEQITECAVLIILAWCRGA